MRAGSVRSIGLAESKRGRRVCCMIMSSGVVGMNGNNRASLCYSPCPSCTQRESKLFPIAFPPNPHLLPPSLSKKKNSFHFHRHLLLSSSSSAGSNSGSPSFMFVKVNTAKHNDVNYVACFLNLFTLFMTRFGFHLSVWRPKQIIEIVKWFSSIEK